MKDEEENEEIEVEEEEEEEEKEIEGEDKVPPGYLKLEELVRLCKK